MSDILAKTPDALAKRERVVNLIDGGVVVVRRWNWAREVVGLKLVVDLIGKFDLEKLKGPDPIGTVAKIIDILGDRVPQLVSLSLDEAAFAMWDEMSPPDRLEILKAVFDLNHLEVYAKKLLGAWSLLQLTATASESSSR
jgi:hypothetical protein